MTNINKLSERQPIVHIFLQVLHNPKRGVNLKGINLPTQIEHQFIILCRMQAYLQNKRFSLPLHYLCRFVPFELLVVAYCLEISNLPDLYLSVIHIVFKKLIPESQSISYFKIYLICIFMEL